MTEALIVSNLVLWVAVLALLATVFALTRQIGVLYERIAPMGALMIDAGPKIGEAAPSLELRTLDGQAFATGGTRAKSLLIFFLSPTCPVCKKLLPILQRIAADERAELEAAAGDQPVSTWLRDVGLAEARRQRGEPAPVVVPLDEAIEALEWLARR